MAETEAAEAEALAMAARSRAAELRRQADSDPEDSDGAASEVEGLAPETPSRRTSRSARMTVVCGVMLLCSLGLLAVSGLLVRHHQQAETERQRTAEYTSAARQIVVTLMSIDSAKAKDSVQAIIDSSAGQFKSDFEDASEDFVKVAQDAKVSTKAAVQAAAVQTMSADTAQVLVTVTSTVSNAAGADRQPRSWRLSLELTRDGGQIKMSKLEFVP
ncbi:hypothetical protein [Mycobacteroides abscessus]|uniref:hypothetical protein n=1 Tax=Mycobacteroides abscessus TaxID=36809 RepID=UPI0021020042|nr:hypothetical protein [Mycobacteroides abscessus]